MNQIILHDVAIIDSLQNQWIEKIPSKDNALLISVIEIFNQGEKEIELQNYINQEVKNNETVYETQIFTLDKNKVQKNEQAYIYLISEVPKVAVLGEQKSKVEIELQFGESKYRLGSEINNNFGLQDLIDSGYDYIQEGTKQFQLYWYEDLKGFQKLVQQRTKINNYNMIYDWVEATQKEYKDKINILSQFNTEMESIRLVTPIYPDANIKLIKETRFLINNLQAIVNAENTCDTKEGLELFIKVVMDNLEISKGKNKVVISKIEEQIHREFIDYQRLG